MSDVRVRRHTDGRVALGAHGVWVVIPGENWFRKDDSRCSGEGWSELLVAELPEPDGWDGTTPVWRTSTSCVSAEGGTVRENGMRRAVARSDALKMLAAVAACERGRAERDVKTC